MTGSYSGSSDMPNLAYDSRWALNDEDIPSTFFFERDFSSQTANHVVNGLDDGNAGNFSLIGSSTGTLLPGNYSMSYKLSMINTGFETGTGNATGFANLTLTSLIPEPASAVLLLLGLGAGLSYRQRLI